MKEKEKRKEKRKEKKEERKRDLDLELSKGQWIVTIPVHVQIPQSREYFRIPVFSLEVFQVGAGKFDALLVHHQHSSLDQLMLSTYVVQKQPNLKRRSEMIVQLQCSFPS